MHLNSSVSRYTLYSFLPGILICTLLRLCSMGLFHFWAFEFNFISPYISLDDENLANSWRAFVEVKNKGGNLSLQVSGLLTLWFSSSLLGLFNFLLSLVLHVMMSCVCCSWGCAFQILLSPWEEICLWLFYFRGTHPKTWAVEGCSALDVSRDLLRSAGWLVV